MLYSFQLTEFEEGLVVSIIYAGATVGSCVGGYICDFLGRWRTIHLQNGIFILGAIVAAAAQNITTLCIGLRFYSIYDILLTAFR